MTFYSKLLVLTLLLITIWTCNTSLCVAQQAPESILYKNQVFRLAAKNTITVFCADATLRPVLVEAFNTWQKALEPKNRRQLQWVNAPAEAHWAVERQAQPPMTTGSLFIAGQTRPQLNMRTHALEKAVISLPLTDRGHRPLPENRLYAIVLHEMGHALGLLGHSANPIDVMFSQNVYQTQNYQNYTIQLSPNDVAALRFLYEEP